MISSNIGVHYQILTRRANDTDSRRAKHKPFENNGSLYQRVTDWTRDVTEKSSQRLLVQDRDSNAQLLNDDEAEAIHSQYCDYGEIVLGSMAYRWLLSKIGNCLMLDTDNADSMIALRMILLHVLNQPHGMTMTRSTQPPSGIVHVDFLFHWALESFLRRQFGDKEIVLGDVITLIGSGVDAQALTCSSYLRQTWPCTGLGILGCVQDAFDTRKERKSEQSKSQPNPSASPTSYT